MSTEADLEDNDICRDGQGEVEDGEREADMLDSEEGEIDSNSENENSDGEVEPPVDDESDERSRNTGEFVDSEPKTPSVMSNASNDQVISADNESDEEHVERAPYSVQQTSLSSANIDHGEIVARALTLSTSNVTTQSEEEVRIPIKIEYCDDVDSRLEAIIRSPSPERESEIQSSTTLEQGSDVCSPSFRSKLSCESESQNLNPELAASIADGVFEPQKPARVLSRNAESPTPSSAVRPESTINSSSVGFESLSPQSMIDEDDASCGNMDGLGSIASAEAPQKPVAKQSLEDQEGELDFEEETPEERRDAAAAAAVASELVTKHKKITMATEKTTSPIKKALPKADNLEDKEEGEEGEDGEDGEDDGELEDDDDLEEGEVKESTGVRKIQPKPICRFYSKGQCTWGSACRFLHPGVNDKGNYNMFAPTKPLVPSNNVATGSSPYVWPARPPAVSPTFGTRSYVEPLPLPLPPPPPPPPPPPHFEEPVRESAWERGLRQAKEILRKSTKRKETEPDFEEKRMNLSLSTADTTEYEKEKDYYSRSSPYRHVTTSADPYSTTYVYDEVPLDPYERQAHDYWRGGNYENFEVRYTRSDYQYRHLDRSHLKDRELDNRDVRNRERDLYRDERERADRSRREKFDRVVRHTPERTWREDRYADHQPVPSRSTRGERGDEWCDPWRRSTSPKRCNLSRSFSSHSSVSYSSSGHSSGSRSSSYSSHSRSSSASSNSSFSRSRSYSPNHAVKQHHQHQQHHHPGQQVKPSPRERSNKFPSAGISGSAPDVYRRPKPLPPGGHIPLQQPSSGARPPPDKRPSTQTQAIAITSQPQPSGDRKRPQKPATQAAPKAPNRHRSLSSSGSDSFSSRSKGRVAANSAAWAVGSRQRKSSRSRSSRSRNSSGSSLVSVSSKSSASSKSSFNSGQNMSTLDALKREERRVREREKMRTVDVQRRPPPASSGGAPDREKTSNVRESRDSRGGESQADLRARSLMNAPRTSKDPLRQAGQKPQIKLTLLNKAPPPEKASAAPPPARKQVAEVRKQKPVVLASEKEPSKPTKASTASALVSNIRKRPLPASPSCGGPDITSTAPKTSSRGMSAASGKPPPVSAAAASLLNKKSTSSRREELLKQLKAVEDAIARKRAKFT